MFGLPIKIQIFISIKLNIYHSICIYLSHRQRYYLSFMEERDRTARKLIYITKPKDKNWLYRLIFEKNVKKIVNFKKSVQKNMKFQNVI